MQKKAFVLLVATIALVSALLSGCSKMTEEVAVMETNQGTIILEFYPELAPNHVKQFKRLANEGFYDGILFHRVIPGFMIQGGCPNTKDPDAPRHLFGTGGSGTNVNAEFSQEPHVRGTLSAARSSDPNSADSQFFICVARAPHLDGQYSVYGKVISGMEVADKIVSAKRDARDCPLEPMKIESVKIIKRSEANLPE